MPKYIVVISPTSDFTPEYYPDLFEYINSINPSVRLSERVIGLVSDRDREYIFNLITKLVLPEDEVIVAQVSALRWRIDEKSDQHLASFLGQSTDQ